ncbi:MAG: c-type cytochrome [Verrucomicrobia bacterium]|nr:c-type cytochrome [Verrucomicrobiota bacterium]
MKRNSTLAALVGIICSSFLAIAAVAQSLPVGSSGLPLNLDFEQGTLKDWKAEGKAFEGQPIQDDTVAKRRAGGSSAHQGRYWIGGFEKLGDNVTGTLTSVPFKVTHPYATFLVAGGGWPATRVEVVELASGKVFFKAHGEESETLRPVLVDLRAQQGKEIFIRLVDEQTGHWGHINFDDFKFHDKKPKLVNAIDVAKQGVVPEADTVLHAGLSGEEAVKVISMPPGFKATLFAGEPDILQPIAFCFDDRGRLWVAEGHTYPIRAKDGEGRDRIIVFEDTDGDGKFNKRTVFIEKLNLVSGLEYGFGGVWVGAAPHLLFIPVQEGDVPKPAGEPKVMLDGWGWQDTHETLNTFLWGPDGWLYGCHGVFTHSNVGKPGASDSERTKINAGIWRYHPTKQVFEVFSEGMSNPWGLDYDEHGQFFAEACVIPHLFHMIQGGRYHRQAGTHFNPYIFDDIKTCADHVHYAGNKGPHAGNNRSDAAGGGHAHAGLMIYQGDNWPEEYRGNIFIGNIAGQRINMDIPERKGSGFVATHAPDPINFNDSWSQVINFRTGPDGAVYFIDWYDKQQCHNNNPNDHDRSNGRIYKISYGEPKFEKVDLQKLSDEKLMKLLASRNNWQARHAQRILQERHKDPKGKVASGLIKMLNGNVPTDQKLRALWTLSSIGSLSQQLGIKLYKNTDEYVRAWTVQLLIEGSRSSSDLVAIGNELVRMAREDKSPIVRLYLASALQRLPVDQRWDVLEALYNHSEDAGDHNIPLMVWYAAEPLAALDTKRALLMAEKAKLPNILSFTVRRTAALGTPEAMATIVESLKRVSETQKTIDILTGLNTALRGQRSVAMPRGWEELESKLASNSNPEIRAQLQALSLTFGSSGALASLRNTVLDKNADTNTRRVALESLLGAKPADMASLLQALLSEPGLRGTALRGLAAYDDSQTAAKIVQAYNSFDPGEKRDALNTLVSRIGFAKNLVQAVAEEKVPKQDLSADLIRQLRALKNEELNKDLEKVWGAVREASADKQKEIAKFRQIFRAGGSQPGDASRGRAVYDRACAQCHILFDVGGTVGPDLTGSSRGDLEYILENMVDPNAVIPNDYRTSTIDTKDDRVITGIVKKQDDKSVTIVTANETLVIPRDEIASIHQSELSMMPEGLLDPLNDQEVRDLIYYLRQPGQVPLPKVTAN